MCTLRSLKNDNSNLNHGITTYASKKEHWKLVYMHNRNIDSLPLDRHVGSFEKHYLKFIKYMLNAGKPFNL